jgi:hypothetical protein
LNDFALAARHGFVVCSFLGDLVMTRQHGYLVSGKILFWLLKKYPKLAKKICKLAGEIAKDLYVSEEEIMRILNSRMSFQAKKRPKPPSFSKMM